MEEALLEWRPVIDETIGELLPREIDADYLEDFFGAPTFAYDVEAIQHSLANPIWDLLDSGGKRWRAVLFLVVVEALGEDPDAYLSYACIPEILHNGTIIVDDVEDEASTRRGGPALHHTHGKDVALNAGNALYFIPLNIIARNDADLDAERRLRAYEMLTHEFNRTHLGQGMDIRWHNEHDITVGEDEYYEMCACKTGCLTRIVARLAAIVTGQPRDVEMALAEYAERMAISFQIADDILDVEHTLEEAGDFGKEFGNDIKEGKKTLMSIHTAEHAPPEDVARLEDILWAEDNSEAEILEAIDIMQRANALEYARERAREFAADARDRLDPLDLEDEAEDQLRAFTTYVIERSV